MKTTRTAEENLFISTLSDLRAVVREVEIPASEYATCADADFGERMFAVQSMFCRVGGLAVNLAHFACSEWSCEVRSHEEAKAVIRSLRRRFFAAVEMQRGQRTRILDARVRAVVSCAA